MVAVKPDSIAAAVPASSPRDRYQVSVEQYVQFRQTGYLVVPNLVSQEEIAELQQHTEDLMAGRLPEQQGTRSKHLGSSGAAVLVNDFGAPPEGLSPQEKANFFLRIHMLHRKLALHERYMLHPRVLDVLEVIIGPDVLAMQTMLFLKPPGSQGQGWHQDSYYIPTFPDSLLGAWIAIDDCDEWNGAMWFAAGSQREPIYPPADGYGYGQRDLGGIRTIAHVSDVNDEVNELAPIADRYPQLLVSAKAGDVVFFGGHVLHRSKANRTADRFRRAFVSHYCNARSFTQWGADGGYDDVHAAQAVDPATKMTNGSHILARGDTHLPFARPRFGTPCAALLDAAERRRLGEHALRVQADMASGDMGVAPADPDRRDDDSPYST